MPEPTPPSAPSGPEPTAENLGAALRAAREARGLSLREVARQVEVSPSFVSQVELGKAKPSVGTLYALVSVLGISLNELLGAGPADGPAPDPADAPTPTPAAWPRIDAPVVRAGERRRVQMSGVVWERLTADDPLVDFLHVEYGPGSASCPEDDMVRHGGREYGVIVTGRLEVQVGFETYSLGPGDSIHFDSSTPHRLSNPHGQPCTAVWFVLARRDDARVPPTATPAAWAHLPGLL
ncbi:cupin domain-containing protein [Knoellia sp. 3-2P3]|uniref:helix-turn-helix domain-containing protein n=1 Tax=unclassified Knoellia TaxID=2618719 RepID=UPI0023D9C7CB|nr:helix-turn-helix domain-containing protein [Knoellia sp. 3-2P3]MDF2093865.1 cupin domain-containing protein [Knoellia sp. 3-2P3]